MNVTIVCPPSLTVTVAVAVPVVVVVLGTITIPVSNPALGNVDMPAVAVSTGVVSTIATEPAVTCTGELHVPPGAAPAASKGIGFPATVKANIVPAVTPEPAILQT